MGYSLTSVPFFTDDIAIKPHTATNGKWLGRKVTIKRFTRGAPCSLERIEETGEYIVRIQGGEFMQGPKC